METTAQDPTQPPLLQTTFTFKTNKCRVKCCKSKSRCTEHQVTSQLSNTLKLERTRNILRFSNNQAPPARTIQLFSSNYKTKVRHQWALLSSSHLCFSEWVKTNNIIRISIRIPMFKTSNQTIILSRLSQAKQVTSHLHSKSNNLVRSWKTKRRRVRSSKVGRCKEPVERVIKKVKCKYRRIS